MSLTKKVLVTGASGFIGRFTVLALENIGWQVTKTSRLARQGNEKATIYLDLSNPSSVLELEKSERFDAIVHLGAHVGLSESSASQMFVPNVLSTGYLAHLSRLWNAHMIYASTAIVHGLKTESISAFTKVSPDTDYANTKWLGEELIVASNAKYTILRLSGVFGSNGPSHLGLNRSIDAAIRGKAPVLYGTGSSRRNYVYVKDVAQAIAYVLQNEVTGTHLLSGKEVLSIKDMLDLVCDIFIPESNLLIETGVEAVDQLVQPSTLLPDPRGFKEALVDIKKGCSN